MILSFFCAEFGIKTLVGVPVPHASAANHLHLNRLAWIFPGNLLTPRYWYYSWRRALLPPFVSSLQSRKHYYSWNLLETKLEQSDWTKLMFPPFWPLSHIRLSLPWQQLFTSFPAQALWISITFPSRPSLTHSLHPFYYCHHVLKFFLDNVIKVFWPRTITIINYFVLNWAKDELAGRRDMDGCSEDASGSHHISLTQKKMTGFSRSRHRGFCPHSQTYRGSH